MLGKVPDRNSVKVSAVIFLTISLAPHEFILHTPQMFKPTTRQFNLAACLICFGSIAFAAYLQLGLGHEPCPLCIVQRFLILILGLLFLGGALHTPQGAANKLFASSTIFVALLGVATAWRQVYLQKLPPEALPDCGPSLSYMLEKFPLSETIRTIITGSGECAEITWQFLGFSIPQWTLGVFVLLAFVGLKQYLHKK